MDLPQHLVETAVKEALAEDLGLAGDITTNALIDAHTKSTALLVSRDAGVLAGLPVAIAAFTRLDPDIQFNIYVAEGGNLQPQEKIASVYGSTRAILSAERVALNFIQRLSGIATATREYVRAIEGTTAKIVCTRKTTPGHRALEKYAVRTGGGTNHRFGLFDAVLIKDNHIVAAGGVSKAIEKIRSQVGHLVKIEVEVDTLDQLSEALHHQIDAVLFDNMSPPQLTTAVKMTKQQQPHVTCEASGGVRLDTVRAIAETGVDRISIGALTHSVRSLDIGLDS